MFQFFKTQTKRIELRYTATKSFKNSFETIQMFKRKQGKNFLYMMLILYNTGTVTSDLSAGTNSRHSQSRDNIPLITFMMQSDVI
jgi:hypothetical protein